LAFAATFFLRSAHRFFIISDSFLRPAALSLLAGLAQAALLLGTLLVACLACEFELDRNFVVDLLHDPSFVHLVVSSAKLSALRAYSFIYGGRSM
jgi:hypothetical protein